MENENNKQREHIRKLVSPIFNRAIDQAKKKGLIPHEQSSNHMSVGSETTDLRVVYLFQPHDPRLYLDFNKETFNPKKPSNQALRKIKSMVPTFNPAYTYTSKNYDSEHQYTKFMNCNITVKKTQVEIRNLSHAKQWRRIIASTIPQTMDRIDSTMENLKQGSIEALKLFIELHGGKSEFKILKERCEHGIHGDDFLDKIPSEMIINDTCFKKVYKHKPEFKSTVYMKNYINSRAIENVAPEIASELNKIGYSMEKASESLNTMADLQKSLFEENKAIMVGLGDQIKSHLDLVKEWREEAIEMRKPFFVRWYEYFKK